MKRVCSYAQKIVSKLNDGQTNSSELSKDYFSHIVKATAYLLSSRVR